jgi:hypothetical protein
MQLINVTHYASATTPRQIGYLQHQHHLIMIPSSNKEQRPLGAEI